MLGFREEIFNARWKDCLYTPHHLGLSFLGVRVAKPIESLHGQKLAGENMAVGIGEGSRTWETTRNSILNG